MPRAWLAALLFTRATTQRTPVQRVYDALDSSVAFFPQITNAADAAQIIAETLSHPFGLAVLNGRVFARDHAGIDKTYLRHLRLVLDAAARHAVGNVVVAHDTNSDGCVTACVGCTPGSDERHLGVRAFPSTTVAKRGDACGVLVPTAAAQAPARPTTVPYARRQNKAFWRGRLVAPGDDSALCVGNRARVEGLSLTLREPRLFDVKALSISPAWGRNGSCLPLTYSRKLSRRLHRVTEARRQSHYARYNYYARYKMLLHFPGDHRRWTTDAVILHWTHAGTAKHYFPGPGLTNGTTHLDVDIASAAAAARAVLGDPTLSDRLRAGARAIAEDLTCPECVEKFLADALFKLRARHLQQTVLDDRHALRAALRGASCSGLVEYVSRDAPINGTHQLRSVRSRFQKEYHAHATAHRSTGVDRLVAPVPLPDAVAPVGFDPACVALVEAAFPT